MNYQVVVPLILLWAGLGEMYRSGLQDFCDKCMKCARECPSQALSYGDKVMHNGYEKWLVDVKKCTSMRVGNQRGSG